MAKSTVNSSGWLTDGIVTGLISTAASTAIIAAYGVAKTGNAWTPFNALSHLLFGEKAVHTDGFAPRESLTGLGLMGFALGGWGVLYEAAAGRVSLPQSLATGAAASATVYALDYHIFPPKLRPGFEKRTGNGSVAAVYIALALCFGLSPLWKKGAGR